MSTKQEWEWLTASSHYQTAVAVQQLLNQGKLIESSEGLDELIKALEGVEKRVIKNQLILLMRHILKWKCQPERRVSDWSLIIRSARTEIEDSQEEVPSLNQDFIKSIWDKCFNAALKEAEIEMGNKSQITSLSWKEVFEDEYTLLR
ncbi:DUF29 family protein [Cyanobacteria bacterium FACHB-472]|nr:DUF29 family protein [Cyanobacteria bacterium FACHB-472]